MNYKKLCPVFIRQGFLVEYHLISIFSSSFVVEKAVMLGFSIQCFMYMY